MFWLGLWESIKSGSKKAWAAIKKLPHWAMIAFFVLIALVWWIFQQYVGIKRKAAVRTQQLEIEKEYARKVAEIEGNNKVEEERLRNEFEEGKKKLDAVSLEIDEAAKMGPVGIANAWADFLGGNK